MNLNKKYTFKDLFLKTEKFEEGGDVNKEDFKWVINKLPHISGRIPYTYHHDYLRAHSKFFQGKSRAEVAGIAKDSEKELYAVALVQLLDSIGSSSFEYIDNGDIEIIKEAKRISDLVVSRYSNNFRI